MARHTPVMGDGTVWAIEGAPNPTVLRVHVRTCLTDRTIVSCPPDPAPPPFDRFLEIEGVRSIDLHPYRVRVNLLPGGGRGSVSPRVTALLRVAYGPAVTLGVEPPPRAFAHPYDGARRVAESAEMADASGVQVAAALFEVTGVSEVVLGPGVVLVRIGRLFDWGALASGVVAAVAGAQ
jgi:hypothetical protein